MELPWPIDDLISGTEGKQQVRRWALRVLVAGVVAAVGWNLADAYIDGNARSFFYQLFYTCHQKETSPDNQTQGSTTVPARPCVPRLA